MVNRFIGFCWRMAGYCMLIWLGCAVNVGFFHHPFKGAPGWLLALEFIAYSSLITVCEAAVDHERKQREEKLELFKHWMTLQQQAGKLEPRDDTRLPPEMLKAFERKEAENGQPSAMP